MVQWAKIPVPFRITTTCGQEKSLPWIKANELENPSTTFGVVKRMALEILFFRSLFRNTNVELKDGPRVIYWSAKWLWLARVGFSLVLSCYRHQAPALFHRANPFFRAFCGYFRWASRNHRAYPVSHRRRHCWCLDLPCPPKNFVAKNSGTYRFPRTISLSY